jgi:hypothetical protein
MTIIDVNDSLSGPYNLKEPGKKNATLRQHLLF